MKDREYHREYSKNYYYKRKHELFDKLGGKCAKCGSTEHLEFDHIDPENKSFNISKLLNHSKNAVDEELSKCQLLCHDCHLQKSKVDISKRVSGKNNPFYGKQGIKVAVPKPVIDLDTGVEYSSAAAFARKYNLNRSNVTVVCRGEYPSIHGHHITYK